MSNLHTNSMNFLDMKDLSSNKGTQSVDQAPLFIPFMIILYVRQGQDHR
jgi:hypothetical protein